MKMASVNWFISLHFAYNIVLIPSPLPSLVEGLGMRLGYNHSFCCAELKGYCRGLGGGYTTHSPNSLLSTFAHMLLFLRPVWVGDSEGEKVEWFGRLLDASVDCFLLGANLSTQNLSCKGGRKVNHWDNGSRINWDGSPFPVEDEDWENVEGSFMEETSKDVPFG